MPFQVVESLDLSIWCRRRTHATSCHLGFTFRIQRFPRGLKRCVRLFRKRCLRETCGRAESYISLTIHYISPDWKLMSHCLKTMYFLEDHTHAHILEMIDSILQAWKIPKENIVCFTTDNASNMRKASEDDQHPWVWLGCFGNNLDLAISKKNYIVSWYRDINFDIVSYRTKNVISLHP